MHGIIFSELKKYVDTKLGGNSWSKLLQEAGLGNRNYWALHTYPDQEAVALVSAASRITGKPAGAILEDFGEFIVPDLVSIFGSMIDPKWRTLEFIEKTEETIHEAVRLQNPGAKPPKIKSYRSGIDEIVIIYSSARQMCGIAKGIVRGVARHYDEEVIVNEPECMLRGDPSCEIRVRLKE